MKKIILGFAIVMALTIPITAFAASADSAVASNFRSFCAIGVDASNLTNQQKADITQSFDKMIELRKETIIKMVKNGSITEEQGDLQIKRIEVMIKNHNENENGFGLGRMDSGMMYNNSGYRMMNWYNNGKLVN